MQYTHIPFIYQVHHISLSSRVTGTTNTADHHHRRRLLPLSSVTTITTSSFLGHKNVNNFFQSKP